MIYIMLAPQELKLDTQPGARAQSETFYRWGLCCCLVFDVVGLQVSKSFDDEEVDIVNPRKKQRIAAELGQGAEQSARHRIWLQRGPKVAGQGTWRPHHVLRCMALLGGSAASATSLALLGGSASSLLSLQTFDVLCTTWLGKGPSKTNTCHVAALVDLLELDC